MKNFSFVLDCSITMTWLFMDETTEYTNAILKSLSQSAAIVPPVWSLEVNNVLLVAERKKRITHTQAITFKQALKKLPIYEDDIGNEAYEIAREFHLSAYDASYLELALRKNLPIATLDKALILAAKTSNVMLFLD